ncbi:LTA synthase family protein [Flavobacterium sp. HSC-61S13]|uniref:LTA synthase family protein n=1 Tax=Flavobacterium sp. HSC-61S13 TaxID=2910963 RepID=UPI00209CD464|nr:alkaline phosphatase family protein [Flavobacterium sp. HSC-61S13]MCP1995615.1 phosphoglycerol transferase MdoB-like AlkP superfamily enzyme [Flavobacterium sp. HSC-61S13]
MNIKLFKNLIQILAKNFMFFLVLFFVSRLLFVWSYGNSEELSANYLDVIVAFIMGGRFDISVICYGFLPVLLTALIGLFIPQQRSLGYLRFFASFCKYYLLIPLLVFLSLLLIDYFFYQFFQSHINVLFFGIFKDDTTAVLDSVWKDYPIFSILLIYIVTLGLFLLVSSKIVNNSLQRFSNSKVSKVSWLYLLILPLFFIGLRGSVGLFTLRRDHTNVSTVAFINALSYNGIYALKFAKSELNTNSFAADLKEELVANQFNSLEEAYIDYRPQAIDSFDNEFISKTAQNDFLEKNPPNVVFVLMESMSYHYFQLHSKELNLLGDLEKELPYLYQFNHALSSFNGTIYSLENLTINTPKNIISQSEYFDVNYSGAVAKPFKEQGYQTYFLSGANTSWRNVDNFLLNQYFDIVQGKAHILKRYPDAEEFAWGAHDEYLFDYIEDKLKENTKKPKFIFALTISNHTPYEIPKHHKSYPIHLSDSLKNAIRIDEQLASDNFAAHQYAASQLAKLIRDVRNSPLGKNTIIVATGDHNIRQVFEYNEETSFLKRSVPILMYIPEAYKPAVYDKNILAAHKDIFPTLFNLSLSNQKYVYSGDNLFSPKKGYRFAVNEYNYMADSVGAISYDNDKMYYYQWTDAKRQKLKVADAASEHALYMNKKFKSYKMLQTAKIYQDIERQKKK